MTTTGLDRTTPSAAPVAPAATATLTYVFAVCRTADPDTLAATAGHAGGGPLRLLALGRLALLVQDVPAEAFSEEELRRRLGDRADLERCARDHHAAVVAAGVSGPVVPFPLATLYRSDRRAVEALSSGEGRFTELLDRLAGHVEWAVKVHLSPTAARPEPVTREPRETPGGGTGRAYLSRVSGRQRRADEERRTALEAAERIDRALRQHASAAVRHRLHSPELTGRGNAQVLNAAYLVAENAHPSFARALTELRTTRDLACVEIDVTGPWVPYSFTETGGEETP